MPQSAGEADRPRNPIIAESGRGLPRSMTRTRVRNRARLRESFRSASWPAARSADGLQAADLCLDAGMRRLARVIQGGRGLPHSKTLRAQRGRVRMGASLVEWHNAILPGNAF